MIEHQKATQTNFRAWPENRKRLEFAAEHDLNVSEVINACLSKHLKGTIVEELKRKQARLTKALSADVP